LSPDGGAYHLLRRDKPLRRLLAAQTFSDFADWLHYVAVAAVLAFEMRAAPVVFAYWAVALGAPYLLTGPIAGALVDRLPLRTVLIVSNLGRAATTAAMVLAGSWPALLALVFLGGLVDGFFKPAKQAALQAMTEPGGRLAANGISHAINQSAKIIAPALGGAALALTVPDSVFLANAAVSLAAALLCASLPRLIRPAPETREAVFASIAAGLRLVRGTPALRTALTLMALGFFAMFFYDTLIPPLTRALGLSETAFGLSMAAVGAGGVLGAVALGSWPRDARPFRLIALGTGVGALTIGALGLAEMAGWRIGLLPFLGLFFVTGAATALSVVPTRTIIQNETPPERIGLVTSLSEAANTAALSWRHSPGRHWPASARSAQRFWPARRFWC